MLTPYPQSLPVESWAILSDMINGKMPARNVAIHTLYEIAGFLFGKLFPDGPVVMASTSPPYSDDEVKAAIHALANPGVKAAGIADLPWKGILKLVLNLILQTAFTS